MKPTIWKTVFSMNAVSVLFLCMLSTSCGMPGQEFQWGTQTYWIKGIELEEMVVTNEETFSAPDGMVFVKVKFGSVQDTCKK